MSHRKFRNHSDTISGRCELDSHADTCVAGSNCVILEETNQTVSVSAFTDAHKTFNNVPVITAATAYDDERTGTTYILILGQAIYMADSISNTLLCPNQLRKHGIIVNDCPKHLAPPNNPSSHSIICEDNGEALNISLNLNGVTSYFNTRTPTTYEIETCRCIHLTDEFSWDPHSDTFQEQEELFEDVMDLNYNQENRQIYSVQTMVEDVLLTEHGFISHALDDCYLINLSSTRTSVKQSGVTPETSAKKWNIGIDTARKTFSAQPRKVFGARYTL
jgi:hypothetical protein